MKMLNTAKIIFIVILAESLAITTITHANNEDVKLEDIQDLATSMYTHNHDAVSRLLQKGIAIPKDYADDNGDTVIIQAAKSGFADVLNYAIDHGEDINAVNKLGCTALMYASKLDNAEIVSRLLQANANVDIRSKFGWTALMMAMARGSGSSTYLLLSHGAQVKDTKFMYASILADLCAHGKVDEFMKLLKSSEFNVNMYDDSGFLLLTYAIGPGNGVCTKSLVEVGAKMDAFDYGMGQSVTEYATDHPTKGANGGYPPKPGYPWVPPQISAMQRGKIDNKR